MQEDNGVSYEGNQGPDRLRRSTAQREKDLSRSSQIRVANHYDSPGNSAVIADAWRLTSQISFLMNEIDQAKGKLQL